MWVHDRIKVELWKGQRAVYKQQKYNGHRFTVYKQQDGTLLGFEREVRPDLEMTVRKPCIVNYDWWRKLLSIPPLSSVDGELCIIGGNAGDATHAIAECSADLKFVPFSVPYWDGADMRNKDVLSPLRLLQTVADMPIAEPERITAKDSLRNLLKEAANRGIEGFVLKEFNYSNWYKVKPQKTVDCIITGFKDGVGKYSGLVGSLIVSVYADGKLVEIANISGMDDMTREGIDPVKDMGRVVEVEYQEFGNRQRLVHAHFLRWRDDKPANQCVYQLDEL